MKVILSLLMLFPINAFSQFNFWHGMVSAQKKEYPYGTMGDLVVLSGQTVSLEVYIQVFAFLILNLSRLIQEELY